MGIAVNVLLVAHSFSKTAIEIWSCEKEYSYFRLFRFYISQMLQIFPYSFFNLILQPGSAGMKLRALKFLETFVLLFTSDTNEMEPLFAEGINEQVYSGDLVVLLRRCDVGFRQLVYLFVFIFFANLQQSLSFSFQEVVILGININQF